MSRGLADDHELLAWALDGVIREAEGSSALDLHQRVVGFALKARSGDSAAADTLAGLVAEMSLEDLQVLIRSLTCWFALGNLAEDNERVRRLRARDVAAISTWLPKGYNDGDKPSGQEGQRPISGDMVNGQGLRNRAGGDEFPGAGGLFDHGLHQAGDPGKSYAGVQKRLDRDFVCGVERGRGASAGLQRSHRQPERRKTRKIRALKREFADSRQIERLDARIHPPRMG